MQSYSRIKALKQRHVPGGQGSQE